MEYKQLTITRAATINKENYENERIEVSLTAEFEEGDSIADVWADTSTEVDYLLALEAKPIVDRLAHSRAAYWRARFGYDNWTSEDDEPEFPVNLASETGAP